MIKTKKILAGGLNTDDSFGIFPAEDYQNAENVSIVSDADGKMAAIKNVWGDKKISNDLTLLFGNDKTCIGSYSDRENMRVIYFLHSTEDDDMVLCLNVKQETITLLLRNDMIDGDLDFRPESDYRINCITLVGEQLYWTDNYNQPRKINIERALRTFDNTYTRPDGSIPSPYTNLRLQDITIIKEPPVLPLLLTKLDSSANENIPTQINNFIDDSAFQFAYRFIYKDNEVSVLSPYSKLANYNNDDDTTNYDTIEVILPKSQYIHDEVNIVQILSRNGNSGVWSIIKELKRDDYSDEFAQHNTMGEDPYSFYFFNDVAGIFVSDEDAYRVFDNVPLKSRTLESARNRLFLGNNLLGYSPSGAGLSATLVDFEIGGSGDTVLGTYYHFSFWCVESFGIPGDVPLPTEFYEWVVVFISDDGYYVTQEDYLLFQSEGLPPTIVLSSEDKLAEASDTLNDVLDVLINRYVDVNYNCSAEDSYRGIPNLETGDRVYTGDDVIVYGLGGSVGLEPGALQFKTGSKYQIGIVFYDEYLRNAGVLTNDNCIVRTNERDYIETNYNVSIQWNIDLNTTDIPEWAHYYSIVRTKSMNISSFLQHYTGAMKYVSKDDDGNYVFGNDYNQDDTIGLAVDISRIVKDGFGYQFIDGDILKLYFSDSLTVKAYPLADQFGPYVITGKVDDIGTLNDPVNVLNKAIFEIQSPKRGSLEEPFYEVGVFYKVTNPGESNRTLPVIEGQLSGDVYLKERPFDETVDPPVNFVQEIMNINDDYWSEWLQDTGRPNIILFNSGQEYRITNIAYSNVYIQGTKVNGLSRFDLLDYRDLDEQNGSIQKIVNTARTQEYGSVLLAICTGETSSIYLGETRIVDNADNVLLSTSGDVIGTINNLKGGYGTLYPESVAENEGNVYFFDSLQGQVIRYSQNGLEPISDAKMTTWFKDYGRLSSVNGLAADTIIGGFDARTDEYLIYLPAINDVEEDVLVDYENTPTWHKLKKNDYKVLAFSKKYSRWTTSYTYKSEAFAEVANILIRFENGQVYKFTNEVYNTFGGQYYPSRVSVILNENPQVVKEMRGIAIEGNVRPEIVHFQNKRPYLQSSDILYSEFSQKEGIFYSQVLRDRLTPRFEGEYTNALLAGDYIRGQFIEIMIEFGSGSEQQEINFLDFMYSISSGHTNLLPQ